MSSLVRTDDKSPSERFDYWRAAVSEAFVPLDATTANPDGFLGNLTLGELGTIRLTQVSAQGHLVQRTPKLIRQVDPEYYKLGLQIRGYCVLTQAGREAALTPGDLAIYDTSHPYQLACDDQFRMLVLMFPRKLLRVREQDMDRLTAVRISGRQGMGALVSPFLARLGTQIDEIGRAGAVRLSDTVLDLLAATFCEHIGGAELVGQELPRARLLSQIKNFVEERLDDPELTPTAIADANHISTRYLQKLFESEADTVAGWVRKRRLERCRRDLTDPALLERPVGAVAARWGIVDAAHFSRLFRATYGMAPREYRIAHVDEGVIVSQTVSLPETGR